MIALFAKSLRRPTLCGSIRPMHKNANCEPFLDRQIEQLLARESGWLVYTAHGLEDEGWGPMRASYLDRLLARLVSIPSVEILPAGRALAKYAG